MPLVVIGLTGRAGSGKSTVAARLLALYGGERLPFALPLKRLLRLFLEDQGVASALAHRMTDGDLKEVPSDHLGGATPRRAMQTLGTEWGRCLSASLWVDAWRRSAEELRRRVSAAGETILLVADDVRFPNEVEAIRALGGLVVRIDRPGTGLAGTDGSHASETCDLGPADGVIVNDDDLARLFEAVDALARSAMDRDVAPLFVTAAAAPCARRS